MSMDDSIWQKIMEMFNKFKKEAEELLKNPQKLEEFLKKFKEKFGDKFEKGPNFSKYSEYFEYFEYIPLMISMVVSYCKGEYKEIPLKSIIAILAALIYCFSPVDIIPDVIPVIGFVDDALVIMFVLRLVIDDLKKYKKWKEEREKEKEKEKENKMLFSEEIKKYLKNKTTVKNAFNNSEVLPNTHGIYVYRVPEDKIADIEFLDTTTAQETKPNGKTALYPKEQLAIKYNNGDKKTLYIGKAEGKDNIQKRTKQRANYSKEKHKYIPARGGRAMFQIKDWENIGLEFYYFETEDVFLETELLTLYQNEYGTLPVANWKI